MGVVEILLGVVFTLAVGTGFSMTTGATTSAELWVARSAFIVAALALCGTYAYWVMREEQPVLLRLLVAAFIGLAVVVGTTEAMYWIGGRENALFGVPAKSPCRAAVFLGMGRIDAGTNDQLSRQTERVCASRGRDLRCFASVPRVSDES